eukprot:5161564-Amphidinium_carterae.1
MDSLAHSCIHIVASKEGLRKTESQPNLCIFLLARDRCSSGAANMQVKAPTGAAHRNSKLSKGVSSADGEEPVSYTHLTLPTILLV